MATLAVALVVVVLPDVPPTPPAFVTAFALAAAFYLADAYPLHVEGRDQTFTVSLSEIPFVIGLLFCPLDLLIAARCAGGAAALAFRRRQPLEKLLFNMTLQALEAALGATVFFLMPTRGSATLAGDGVAVLVAVLSSSLVAIVAVTVVIRLHSGRWDAHTARAFVRTGLVVLLPNCCAGLLVAEAIWHSDVSIAPAAVVGVALAAAYRTYVNLRQRHETLEMIYDFARSINTGTTSGHRLSVLLESTREALRCEQAELVLLPANPDESAERRSLGPDGRLQTHAVSPGGDDWPVAMVAAAERHFIASRGTKDPGSLRFLAAHGWRDCLLVPLWGTDRVIGVLGVGNRISDVMTFTREDARLLDSIAGQVSSVLENGQLLDRLTHDSTHDALTGLANRTTYQDRLAGALRSTPAQPLAVLIMDLDRFKEVNDTLGHHYGDLLIREVAERLQAAAPSSAVVARLGGDEFAVLLPGFGRERTAVAATLLRNALAQPCWLDGVALEVEASIGIAIAPEQGDDTSVLLKRADMAMYAAKRNHTAIEFYDRERDEYSPRRLALATQIRSAADSGQLELHYQPQLDLQTGEIFAVEALLRWHHPDLGLVPPSEFISIAEQSGAISILARWALSEAVRQAARWQTMGLRLEMSVNVSMRNLLDSSMTDLVAELVGQHGLRPGALTLEVTESQLMADPDRTLPLLHRLAGLGVGLSIDDFGTGYSSLAYLKHLPVREIKVDRSFVRSITDSPQDVAIVRAVIDLACNFGMTVVAEGVEDQPTLELLQSLGCHRVQGYHISHPMAASEVPHWIDQHCGEWRDRIRYGGVARLSAVPDRSAVSGSAG